MIDGEGDEEFLAEFHELSDEELLTPGEVEIEARRLLGNERYEEITAFNEDVAQTELASRKAGLHWMRSRAILNLQTAAAVRLLSLVAAAVGLRYALRRK